MKNAREQFVLLGLMCQALSWEGYFFVFLYAGLWFLCRRVLGRLPRLPATLEGAVLILGCLVGYAAGQLPQQTPHFFLGHGLAWVQLLRLTRPLEAREVRQSILVAFLHLGVACTVVLDYRFLLLLAGAFVLIPRVLMEQAAAAHTSFPAPASAPLARPSWRTYTTLGVAMVLLFILFPRGLIGTPIQLRRGGSEGNLADALLDPSLGGLQQSSRVLLQIEGENVGYLRTLALVDFDGTTWKSDSRPVMVRRFFPQMSPPDSLPIRRVRVKDTRFIDKLLPTDGHVGFVRGKFFRDAFVNLDGTAQALSMWNTGNNLYEYWASTNALLTRLPPRLKERYLQAPAPSPRLRIWVDEHVQGAATPKEQARLLEAHLRDTFTYTLGAPELSRLNALDDFIFNQREGHCERFASALALLLRMQEIPSRVIVGYVPGDPNWMTGWRNVRFRDAHAWTEAWFEDEGWVQFDATPRSSMALADSYFADLIDAVDVMWYLNIVNFDSPTQTELLTTTGQAIGRTLTTLRDHAGWLGSAAFLSALAVWLYRRRAWFSRLSQQPNGQADAQVIASHHYGELLRVLARQGFRRRGSQTPVEFLALLQTSGHPAASDTASVTDFFCEHRYGGKPVTTDAERAIEEALQRVREAKVSPTRPAS